MKAVVKDRFAAAAWEVFLFDRLGSRNIAYVYHAPQERRQVLEPVEYDPNDVAALAVEPTLVLPYDALDAIVRALPGRVTAGDATLDALVDARGTRDRLLALVEAGAQAGLKSLAAPRGG